MRMSVLQKDGGRKASEAGPVRDTSCFALVFNSRQMVLKEPMADKAAVWSLSEAPLGKSQYIFVGFGSKAMSFSANYYLYLEVAQHL